MEAKPKSLRNQFITWLVGSWFLAWVLNPSLLCCVEEMMLLATGPPIGILFEPSWPVLLLSQLAVYSWSFCCCCC